MWYDLLPREISKKVFKSFSTQNTYVYRTFCWPLRFTLRCVYIQVHIIHNENVSLTYSLSRLCRARSILKTIEASWCRFQNTSTVVCCFFFSLFNRLQRNYSIKIHKRLYFTTIRSAFNIIIKALAWQTYDKLSQKLIWCSNESLNGDMPTINRARWRIDSEPNPPSFFFF